MHSYLLGNAVQLTYTSTQAGVLVDAATVTVSVDRPDGLTDGPFAMTHASLGTYTYVYKPPATSAHTKHFTARTTALNPDSSATTVFAVLD